MEYSLESLRAKVFYFRATKIILPINKEDKGNFTVHLLSIITKIFPSWFQNRPRQENSSTVWIHIVTCLWLFEISNIITILCLKKTKASCYLKVANATHKLACKTFIWQFINSHFSLLNVFFNLRLCKELAWYVEALQGHKASTGAFPN